MCVSLVLKGEVAIGMCDEVNYWGFDSYSVIVVVFVSVDDNDFCVTRGSISIFLDEIVNFNPINGELLIFKNYA